MAKPSHRLAVLELAFTLAVVAVVARAAYLQVYESGKARETLNGITGRREAIAARRGAVLDRHLAPLAITNTYYHVGVAPNEVKSADAARVYRAVAGVTGEPLARLRARAGKEKYLYFHGPFDASTVEGLQGLRGVHLEAELRRAYPARDLALPLVGRLLPDSTRGASGIERSMDSVLAGTPGEQVVIRVPGNLPIESPRRRLSDPQPGADVILTIDANLQEIAEHALDSTVRAVKAYGGDVVIMDVRTGELLAAAGVQRDEATDETMPVPSYVTVPFEPGSTAKLFTAAALIEQGKVKGRETVDGGDGLLVYTAPGTRRPRRIKDEHALHGPVTLDTAIKYSSNIAITRFAAQLSWAEQYEALRSFGFGSQSGVETTGEDRGRLALPSSWTGESSASHAMGYEFRLTAVQLAVAYAALANGGVVLTPSVVRGVRNADGSVRWMRQVEPVRQAISKATARRMVAMLRTVTAQGGTGVRAGMRVFHLAGKTGTANRYDTACRCYRMDRNVASFASVFPAEDPQLAIVMKVDGVSMGRGFGGGVAAPAVRSIVEQMLASDRAPVDRAALAELAGMRAVPASAVAPRVPRPTLEADAAPAAVTLPLRGTATSAAEGTVEVPSVAGRTPREAAAALLRAGLRVAAVPGGTVVGTAPDAGARVRAGTLVSLRTN